MPYRSEGPELSRCLLRFAGQAKATRSEAGFLNAFDLHRDRIFKAAGRVYSRHSKGSCTLAASDLQ